MVRRARRWIKHRDREWRSRMAIENKNDDREQRWRTEIENSGGSMMAIEKNNREWRDRARWWIEETMVLSGTVADQGSDGTIVEGSRSRRQQCDRGRRRQIEDRCDHGRRRQIEDRCDRGRKRQIEDRCNRGPSFHGCPHFTSGGAEYDEMQLVLQ